MMIDPKSTEKPATLIPKDPPQKSPYQHAYHLKVDKQDAVIFYLFRAITQVG